MLFLNYSGIHFTIFHLLFPVRYRIYALSVSGTKLATRAILVPKQVGKA